MSEPASDDFLLRAWAHLSDADPRRACLDPKEPEEIIAIRRRVAGLRGIEVPERRRQRKIETPLLDMLLAPQGPQEARGSASATGVAAWERRGRRAAPRDARRAP